MIFHSTHKEYKWSNKKDKDTYTLAQLKNMKNNIKWKWKVKSGLCNVELIQYANDFLGTLGNKLNKKKKTYADRVLRPQKLLRRYGRDGGKNI